MAIVGSYILSIFAKKYAGMSTHATFNFFTIIIQWQWLSIFQDKLIISMLISVILTFDSNPIPYNITLRCQVFEASTENRRLYQQIFSYSCKHMVAAFKSAAFLSASEKNGNRTVTSWSQQGHAGVDIGPEINKIITCKRLIIHRRIYKYAR